MTMGELVRYDAMCRAIADAHEIDEVKDIRDKAIAMAAYFRQAHNIEAERQACEIRLRAERKANHLYDAQEKAKGAPGPGRGKPPRESGGGFNDAPTLKDHGVTSQEMADWRKLGAMPDDQFEAALAEPGIPTRDGIIRSTQEPKSQIIDDTALWVWGQIREFKRLGVLELDPQSLYATMTEHMVTETKEIAPLLADWLSRFT